MKVTLDGIKAKIKGEAYMVLPDGRTTLCMLELENGYTIKGMSACVDPKEFDETIGRKFALEDAVRQIWPLEGYLLADQMAAFQLQDMTFSLALGALKNGCKVARKGWNGKGLWLELQRPDANSKMTLPYIFLSYPSGITDTPGDRVPWLASQTDLLSEDWEIL